MCFINDYIYATNYYFSWNYTQHAMQPSVLIIPICLCDRHYEHMVLHLAGFVSWREDFSSV